MKLMFLGAAHEVTGSCHYIEACGKSILLDCGMEQGRDTYENQEIPVSASDIDHRVDSDRLHVGEVLVPFFLAPVLVRDVV